MSNSTLPRRAFLAGLSALAVPGLATPSLAIAKTATALEPLSILTSRGPVSFQVEVAADDAARARGLMYRKSLAPDRGMLFDFHTPRPVAFWMRNTYISLDMIFIRNDGRIRSIARNTTPMSEEGVPSGGPVRAVLELVGGRAAEIGALPGDRVRHRIFPNG
ncbi:DUF192 domain-containing protein [Phenylobacterium sp.]|uniref:DUF192 domain-containing protein n=1 Tax=Phenylobacterium sp. TaxID=1871053 RepID=UPI0027302003|nr:DUF192 domain-containing protein [Phenylobacterium sp.]MDP1987375.1 DUF192 domain-containing protein [Phenylobacterium sp.]